MIHPRVIRLLDHLLLENYLVTTSQAIEILPGEKSQAFHYDDEFIPVARPRKHFSVGVIWAIDEFTPTNGEQGDCGESFFCLKPFQGATTIFPCSHVWDGSRFPQQSEAVSCVMPAGSCVLFLGTLWHGGGANTSKDNRMAVTFQYCQPFVRPQENQFLSVPFHLAKTLQPSIQSLLGYSVYPPFIGHSNGTHPLKVLMSKL